MTCHHFLSFSGTFISILFLLHSFNIWLLLMYSRLFFSFLTSLILTPAFTLLCLSLWCSSLYLPFTPSFRFNSFCLMSSLLKAFFSPHFLCVVFPVSIFFLVLLSVLLHLSSLAHFLSLLKHYRIDSSRSSKQTALLIYRNGWSFCCLFLKCNLKRVLINSATLLQPNVLLQLVPDRWVVFSNGEVIKTVA